MFILVIPLKPELTVSFRSDVDGGTPLLVAAQRGHINAMILLLKAGAEVDLATRDGATPLFKAIQECQLDTAWILLDHGATVDSRLGVAFGGVTPLMVAAWRGDLDCVQLLLERGADHSMAMTGPNGMVGAGRGDTALQIAADNGRHQCVRAIAGAEPQQPKAPQ